MSAVTLLLSILIAALGAGHAALYYTRLPALPGKKTGAGKEVPPRQEQAYGLPAAARDKASPMSASAADQLLADKVNMAHARLDRLEQGSLTGNAAAHPLMIMERLRKLENTAENNKVDLVAIKQILQDIQSKLN